jgi:hypothetical protein
VKKPLHIKIGLVGDPLVGKRSFILKFVEVTCTHGIVIVNQLNVQGRFSENATAGICGADYMNGKTRQVTVTDVLMTAPGPIMTKTIEVIKYQSLTFCLWNVGCKWHAMSGGAAVRFIIKRCLFAATMEMDAMLPAVCEESAILLFMFELTRPYSLYSIKDWWRKTRKFTKVYNNCNCLCWSQHP